MTTKIKPDISKIDGVPLCAGESCPVFRQCEDASPTMCRPAVLTLLAEVDAARPFHPAYVSKYTPGFDELSAATAAVDAWRKP